MKSFLIIFITLLCLEAFYGSTNSWRFVVVASQYGAGDSSTNSEWVQYDVISDMARTLTNENISFLFVAGNMIYGASTNIDGSFAKQYDMWSNAISPLIAAGIPIYTIRGRNEASESNVAEYISTFAINFPTNGPDAEKNLTYSFTYKNALLIGLDQFIANHSFNTNWLYQQLAGSTSIHTFVFGAEPLVQITSTNSLARFKSTRNFLLDNMVNKTSLLYFCGEDGLYDRALITNSYRKNFYQMMVGSGGLVTSKWDGVYGKSFAETTLAKNCFHSEQTNGYVIVEIDGYKVNVKWKARMAENLWQTKDEFSYSICNPAANFVLDYDGDAKADPAIFNETAGAFHILSSREGYRFYSLATFGTGATPAFRYRAIPGDYDGDGKIDPALYHKQTGTLFLYLSGVNYALHSFMFGGGNYGVCVADYDGDGKTDPAIYSMENGNWIVLLSERNYESVSFYFGGNYYVPIPADYDGDLKADPAIYNEQTGEWVALLSANAYQLVKMEGFGGNGVIAVQGDYDGDLKADPVIYNRANGYWYARLSSFNYEQYYAIFYGGNAIPFQGDFDGKGFVQPAFFYTDSGILRYVNPYTSIIKSFAIGDYNSEPIVNSFWRRGLTILAFGDSITYGTCSSSGGPATGYPKLLKDLLESTLPCRINMINVGNPGEDTEEGMWRLQTELDAYKPDILLLMEGTNDMLHNGYDELEGNLRYMVYTALTKGVKVIIATIPPVITTEYRDRTEQAANIRTFNPRIYNIARDYNIPVAQVYEAITSVSGWEYSLMDRITANHPNDAGYQKVRDAFYYILSAGIQSGAYY